MTDADVMAMLATSVEPAMLATSVELAPVEFVSHLRPLRLVSTELGQKCCLIADEINNRRLAASRAFLATFTQICAEHGLVLVELDFAELATICANRFVRGAASYLRAVLSQPADGGARRSFKIVDVAVDDVLHTNLDALCEDHITELEALDSHEVIARLAASPVHFSRSTWEGSRRMNCLGGLGGLESGGVLYDGYFSADPHRRGPFHVPLASVVRWHAARGRVIDRAAALLYLSCFEDSWSTRSRTIGTIFDIALNARAALLKMHAFLTQRVGDTTAPELQLELRRHFGVDWTSDARQYVAEVVTCACRTASYPEGATGHLAESARRELYYRLANEVLGIFQEMVSEVTSRPLPEEIRAIVVRKWVALMPTAARGLATGLSVKLELRTQVQALRTQIAAAGQH